MTREQAIKVLNMVEAHGLADEAKRMAIKSLEQESILDKCIEIPKDATNGDMFVAVWGYAPSHLRAHVDWWNAPYKKGDK